MKREKLELPIEANLNGWTTVIDLEYLPALGVLHLVVNQVFELGSECQCI
jgi:hypothetical protein